MRVSIWPPTALIVLMISVKYQSDCAALKKKDLPSMVDQGLARPMISPDYPRRPYQISPIDCLFGKRSVYCSDPFMPCHGSYCVSKPDPCSSSDGCRFQDLCFLTGDCHTIPPNDGSAAHQSPVQPDPCVSTGDCRYLNPIGISAAQQSPVQLGGQQQVMNKN